MNDILAFTLRIDKKLQQKLLELAEKDKRSLNSEILYIIEKYIEEQQKNGK